MGGDWTGPWQFLALPQSPCVTSAKSLGPDFQSSSGRTVLNPEMPCCLMESSVLTLVSQSHSLV